MIISNVLLNLSIKPCLLWSSTLTVMNDDEYYEDERYLYIVKDGIVWPTKKNGYFGHTKKELEDYVKTTWKSPDLLYSFILES